jgi:PEP-CTERM motif
VASVDQPTFFFEGFIMKRFFATAAAAAALFAASNAHAVFLSVDEFTSPNLTLWDSSAAPGTIAMSGNINGGATVALGGAYVDPIRTITHNWTADLGGNGQNPNGGKSRVTMGNDASPTGALTMSNVNNSDSIVDIRYNLAAGFVPAVGTPVSFFFLVVGSDTVNKFLSFSTDSGATFNSIGSFNTQVDFPSQVAFTVPLTNAQQATLNLGVLDFVLRISGDSGWDFSIDSFGFQVPEPTSLALVGLALLGAGVATRRRKA